MKKLFVFLGVLAMSAGVVFAQNNDATVSQEGDQNEAGVTQTGADHTATIEQANWGLPAHYATVDQSGGDDNEAYVAQSHRGASAVIQQVGSENFAGLKQAGPNEAGTETANEAGVYQEGDNNFLGGTGFTGNAFMKNGTSFDNDKNWLQVDQLGNDNKAGVWMEHHADGTIYQEGDLNEAIINVTSDKGGLVNEAIVWQKGDENMGSVTQTGFDNWGKIHQTGNLNDATMSQTGDSNWSEITQNGSNNTSTVTQQP